jgi:hypothetical protein
MQHDHGLNFGHDSSVPGLNIEGLGAERESERRCSVVVGGENKQCILHVLMVQCRPVIKSLVRP